MFLSIISLFLFIFFSSNVYATTLTLKNGKTISGGIVNETDKAVNISVGGVVVTYYKDEIDSIDGQSVATTHVDPKQVAEKRELAKRIVDLLPTDGIITDKITGKISQLPKEKRDALISDIKAKLDMGLLNRLRIDGLVEGFSIEELNAGVGLLSSSAGKEFFLKSFTTYSMKKQEFNQLLYKEIDEAIKRFRSSNKK